jgi:AcrR family transcriptional regulator
MLVTDIKLTKSELTKELIFQKTFQIISEKGFASVNHREVANHCGLSVGIVYKHLGPSNDHLKVLMDHVVTQGYGRLAKVPDNLSPLEKVKMNQKINLEFFLGQPGYAILFLHFYINSRFDDDLHKWNTKLTKSAEGRLIEIQGGRKKSAALLASALHSLLVGEIIKFVSLKSKDVSGIIDRHLKQVELIFNSTY